MKYNPNKKEHEGVGFPLSAVLLVPAIFAICVGNHTIAIISLLLGLAFSIYSQHELTNIVMDLCDYVDSQQTLGEALGDAVADAIGEDIEDLVKNGTIVKIEKKKTTIDKKEEK